MGRPAYPVSVAAKSAAGCRNPPYDTYSFRVESAAFRRLSVMAAVRRHALA